MKRPMIVLHVVGRMDIGGAESRIMDLYRNIDREKIQFYFMQHTKDRCAFQDEVESLGGKVFYVPRFNVKNYLNYRQAWITFFKENPGIQAVHGHMTSTASIYLPIAKKAGVPITIAHARSAGVDPGIKGIATRFFRRNLYQSCDYRFTCSKIAGEAVFGEQNNSKRKAVFIPNAIQVDNFVFNKEIRRKIRSELGIENKMVIGQVGRFSWMKNHEYSLQVLEQCILLEKEQKLPETVLLFVGDGERKEEIMGEAFRRGISSRVLFLGNKKEIYDYYQAMDFFLLPSVYEGLPGTAIEAQASGLLGILSNQIAEEVVITDLLEMMSIHGPATDWASYIGTKWKLWENINGDNIDAFREELRENYAEQVKKAAFDVKSQARKMEEFYLTGEINL